MPTAAEAAQLLPKVHFISQRISSISFVINRFMINSQYF